jgi:hypothetical protein
MEGRGLMVTRQEHLQRLNARQREEAEKNLAERFWSKVDKSTGSDCWLWTASLGTTGYGQFTLTENGKRSTRKAHRVAYELAVGPIPVDLVIDHLCRQLKCVRPDHLEPVTVRVNTQRGNAVTAATERALKRTHCRNGHEYTPSNTYTYNGRRRCRTCGALAQHRLRERKRAAAEGRDAA